MFLITTNSIAPFAIGRWIEEVNGVANNTSRLVFTQADPLQRRIDPFGKLEGHYNNVDHFPTPYSQDPNGLDWPYFDRLSDESLRLDDMKIDILSATYGQGDSDSNLLQKLKQTRTSSSAKKTFMENYKLNLTKGFIDDNVFSVPEVVVEN